MKYLKFLVIGSLCSCLIACAQKAPPEENAKKAENKVPVTVTQKRKTTETEPSETKNSKKTHALNKQLSAPNNPRKLANLNGHKTPNSRVLAAGGYIAGAIGGS